MTARHCSVCGSTRHDARAHTRRKNPIYRPYQFPPGPATRGAKLYYEGLYRDSGKLTKRLRAIAKTRPFTREERADARKERRLTSRAFRALVP